MNSSILLYLGDISRDSCPVNSLEDEFSVIKTQEIDEALEELNTSNVGFVIAENTSEVDGIEFLEKLRTVDPEIPFVLLGEIDGDEVEVVGRALSAEVTEYLPIEAIERNPENLLKRVKESIEEDDSGSTKVLEIITDAFIAVDENFEITYVNSEFENLMGVEREDILGEDVWDKFSEAKDRKFYEMAKKAMEEQETVEYEEYYPPLQSWFHVNVYPSKDGLSVYFRDITEKKRVEERLEERERFLSNIVNNIPGMIYRCKFDREWTMKYVSEGCIDVTGYEPDEIIDNNEVAYADIIDPRDRETVWDQVRTTVKEKTDFQMVYRIKTKEGTTRWVSEHAEPVFDEDGEVEAIEGCIQDITEFKMRKQRLEVLNRLMRHNLRNGLNVILGHAELLREKITDSDDRKRLEEIIIKADRLSELTTKAKKLEETLDPEKIRGRPIEIVSVVKKQVEEQREEYPNSKISYDAPESQGVYGNAVIDYALRELIENAVEHNSPSPDSDPRQSASDHTDSEPPTVDISVKEEGDKVAVEIKDNGPGISESEKEALVHGTETSLSHTSGLGLWLVNWIVVYSGGAFEITNHENGAVATIKLQKADLDRSNEDPEPLRNNG